MNNKSVEERPTIAYRQRSVLRIRGIPIKTDAVIQYPILDRENWFIKVINRTIPILQMIGGKFSRQLGHLKQNFIPRCAD